MNRKVPYCTLFIVLIFGLTVGVMCLLGNMKNDITVSFETIKGDSSVLDSIELEATIMQYNGSGDWREVTLQGATGKLTSNKYFDGMYQYKSSTPEPELWIETDLMSNLGMDKSHQDGIYYFEDYYEQYPLSVDVGRIFGIYNSYMVDDSIRDFKYLSIKPNQGDSIKLEVRGNSTSIQYEGNPFQRLSIPVISVGERIFTTIPTISTGQDGMPLAKFNYSGTSGIFELIINKTEASSYATKEVAISNRYSYAIGSELNTEVLGLITSEGLDQIGLVTLEDGRKVLLHQYSLQENRWIGTDELCEFEQPVKIQDYRLYSQSTDFQILLQYSLESSIHSKEKNIEYEWMSFSLEDEGVWTKTVDFHYSLSNELMDKNNGLGQVVSTIYTDDVLYVLGTQGDEYSVYEPCKLWVMALKADDLLYYGIVNSSFYEEYNHDWISYGGRSAWKVEDCRIVKSK